MDASCIFNKNRLPHFGRWTVMTAFAILRKDIHPRLPPLRHFQHQLPNPEKQTGRSLTFLMSLPNL